MTEVLGDPPGLIGQAGDLAARDGSPVQASTHALSLIVSHLVTPSGLTKPREALRPHQAWGDEVLIPENVEAPRRGTGTERDVCVDDEGQWPAREARTRRTQFG